MADQAEDLRRAAAAGDLATIEAIIREKWVNVNAKDKDCETLLRMASLEVLQFLLAKEADINAKDNEGKIALMIASSYGHKDAVQLLLKKGADVNAKTQEGGTALMAASSSPFGAQEMVQILLASGADVNAKDLHGKTALMGTSRADHRRKVQALLDKGADVNAKTQEGGTALMDASLLGHPEVVRALLAHGAKVNAKDNRGTTALMDASDNGYWEVVQVLLAHGAKVNAKDNRGTAALMTAAEKGHPEVVQALLDQGAEVNAKNNKDRTALMIASEKGHWEVVDLLKRAEVKELLRAAEGSNPVAMAVLGHSYMKGDGVPINYAEALKWFEKGASQGVLVCENCLAWLLATCPDNSIRDGSRAVVLAEKMVSKESSAANVDTLAAAYAEVGRFDHAMQTQEEAISKLSGEDMEELAGYRDQGKRILISSF